MTKSPKGWYQGKVPKKAVTGKSLYVLLRRAERGRQDRGRKRLEGQPEHHAAHGGRVLPRVHGQEEEGRRRRERRGRREPARRAGRAVQGEAEARAPPTRPGKAWTSASASASGGFGIGVGSGFGYAKGNGLEAVNMSPDQQFHDLASVFVAGRRVGGPRPPGARGRPSPVAEPRRSRSGADSVHPAAGGVRALLGEGRLRGDGQVHRLHEAGQDQVLRRGAGGRRRRLPFRRLSGAATAASRQGEPAQFQGHDPRRPRGRRASAPASTTRPRRTSRSCSRWTAWPASRSSRSSPTSNLSLQFNFYGGGGGDGKVDPNSSAGRKIGEDTE